MLELDWDVRTSGDVALVAAVVESAAPTPRRVTVGVRADPAWPPRRRGVPERGWSDDAVEGVVPAGGRLALGFATPAGPVEPPVTVRGHERVGPETSGGGHDAATDGVDPAVRASRGVAGGPRDDVAFETPRGVVDAATPDGLVRSLGSPAPPRDGVPDSVTPAAAAAEVTDGVTWDGPAASPDRSGGPARRSADPAPAVDPGGSAELPDPVAAWLADVERRVERAEELAEASDLTAAAGAVERAGGLGGVERLVAALADDEAALRMLAERARSLADRSGAVEDVPVDAYRRLR